MDTTAETREEFVGVRREANRGSASTGASTRYHPPPPPPPPLPSHLSSLHHIHHHHLHHSGTSTATGLLMTPTGILDSTAATASDVAAAHYGQSPGNINASRTGVPHEIGRPGPPHATPAASVSAPSPHPNLQCHDRFFSSLTINTGSNYPFLNGVPAPTYSAASIPAPMSASSPFRTPPGLASVHSHWSHTPPPSPLESYGRYGLGTSFYSLYPMLTGNDANALCLQASAAKLLQRTSPYYPVLDRSRDFGLYHPANYPIGSPFSPSLGTLDPTELSGNGSSSGGLPDFLQQRLAAATTTPFDYICKPSNNSNFGIGSSNKFVGSKLSVAGASMGVNGGSEDDKSKKSVTAKEARSRSSGGSSKIVGNVNGKISMDSNSRPTLGSPKDQKFNGNEARCCASEPSIVKKESKSESCRKKVVVQKHLSIGSPEGATNSGFSAGLLLSHANDANQVQALNLSQDVKKHTSNSSISGAATCSSKPLINDYARFYGSTYHLPFDPSLPLRMTSCSTTSATPSSSVSAQPAGTTTVCDKNIRVKVEPEVKGFQRTPCPYQSESVYRSDVSTERQDKKIKTTHDSHINVGDYHNLNLVTYQPNGESQEHQRNDQMCFSKDCARSSGPNERCQPVTRCQLEDKNLACSSSGCTKSSSKLSNDETNAKNLCSNEKSQVALLPVVSSPSPVVGDVDSINVDEKTSKPAKTNDLKSTIKDECLTKVNVKGSHIESITNKLLAKSQLGVGSESLPSSSSSSKPTIAQRRVQQHAKCRRKSLVVDKVVTSNENETKHSTVTESQFATSESGLGSPVQAAPYDYTLKQQSCNSTFTVTTTSPCTPTTTTMALQQTTGSSFQRCFTEHVHKSLVTASSIPCDLTLSDSSSSSPSSNSSSSSPINVTDIDSSPSTKFRSNYQSDDKVMLKFSGKLGGVDVQLFDRKLRTKLPSALESGSSSSVDGSSVFSHSLTTGMSTIPVGIAVAQQRQDGQTQCKQRSDSLNGKQNNQKCGAQSGSPLPSKSNEMPPSTKPRQILSDFITAKNQLVCFDKSSSGDTSGVATSTSEYASGLMIAGATSCWANDDKARWFSNGHPALWLGQSPIAGAPTSLSMQLSSADHLAGPLPPHPSSHPFPPIGYQLARDPITNHLFLIPTTNINLIERPPLWPSASPVSQLPTLHKPFQTCIFPSSLPTAITTSSGGSLHQQIPSPIITPNRLTQERQHFECNFLSESDKVGNMAVSAPQSVSEAASEVPREKSSIVKGENEEKHVLSTLSGPPTTISQPYCFDAQSSNAALPAENPSVPRISSPSLPCPCHVSPCESKVGIESEAVNQQMSVELGHSVKTEMAKMADACNQTETPPLTDEEEDLKEGAEAIDHPSLSSTSETKNIAPIILSVVKVEDMSVQCELSDDVDLPLHDKGEDSNIQGLELLSKTITERNMEAVTIEATVTDHEEGIKCDMKEFKLSHCEQSEMLATHDDFGGLGLLCALAEQRILQETTGSNLLSDSVVDSIATKEEETDTSYKIPKTNKEFRRFISQKMSQYSSPSSAPSLSESSISIKICSKSVNEDSSVFKTSEMDSAELETRLKLADLQKKYKEKQKELAKLARKDADHLKRKPGRPKKRKKSPKSSFKFNHRLHCAKLSLLTNNNNKKLSPETVQVTNAKDGEQSLENLNNNVVTTVGRAILNPPTLVTSTPKNMSTLDKWTSSLAACPPSLFQLVPTLKKSTTGSATKPSPSSSIFTNLKQQLPPPPPSSSSSGSVATKLSLTALSISAKSFASEVGSPSKGQSTTPDETTTETSDSDDSSLCQPNKKNLKRSVSKSRPLVFSGRDQNRLGGGRRKESLFKNGIGIGSKSRGGQGEGLREESRSAEVDQLSLSFMQTGSLSVSCTMPPFKGHIEKIDDAKEEDDRTAVIEEDADNSGLGLLATCASQATTFSQLPSFDSTLEGGISGQLTVEQVSTKVPDERPKEEEETKEVREPIVLSPSTRVENSVADADKQSNDAGEESNEKELDHTSTKCKYSYLEDEAWLRRRSERIFLNEPSCRSQAQIKSSFNSHNDPAIIRHRTSSVTTTSSSNCGNNNNNNNHSSSTNGGCVSREITVSAAVSAVAAVTGLTWKPRLDDTRSLKKRGVCKSKLETEPSVKKMKANPVASTKLPLPSWQGFENSDKHSPSRSSSDSDSDSPAETSSFSEGDNLPLSKLVDRPLTPEPRSCIIQAEELKDNQRVLTMMDRLFYAGRVVAIRAPDVYGITVDGERGNRPHIYSREEILQEAVMDVKPGSKRYLPQGTRVCAYWSQQYRCLYPGTVAKPTSPSSSPESEDTVLVDFDDGDSGRISVDNVRLLPADLPIISYDRDPLNIGKRRTKSTGDIAPEKRTPLVTCSESHNGKTSQSADKTKTQSEDILKSKDTLNETMLNGKESSIALVQRQLFEVTKNNDDKRKTEEVNNNNSILVQAKLTDLSRIPLVKALYGRQILSATVSVVPLSRSTTPTSSTGSTNSSSCGKTIRSVGAGFSSSSSTSSSLLKSRKHKKHKNNKDDTRKRHHHHHRRHRHKHKHDKRQESMLRAQNSNASKKSTDESTDENQLMGTPTDVKKQELTLKIRTNVEQSNCSEINLKEKLNEQNQRTDEHVINKNSGQILSVNKSETKVNGLDEPLPPRKVKIAKKEDPSIVNSSRPKAKRKERSNSVETKSKIAAFLPARQLWRWSGKGFRRPGAKGKAKKDFYKAITRGKETIRVGDSAVFLSTGRPHLPFIGRIITMWESWGGNMIVKVRWFYHPEETKGGKKLIFNKGALYQSYHIDENDVQTISHKCEVLPWNEYKKYKDQDANQSSGSSVYDNCDVYYLAGSYDPTAGVVTLEAGVS